MTTMQPSARRLSREFTVQALYQLLMGGGDVTAVDAHTRQLQGFAKAHEAHYQALLEGIARDQVLLDEKILPYLSRPWKEVSPVEHAVLWIAAYELLHCVEIPYRVILNEAIELARRFGGSDGHRFVNGAAHALARELRPAEMQTLSA